MSPDGNHSIVEMDRHDIPFYTSQWHNESLDLVPSNKKGGMLKCETGTKLSGILKFNPNVVLLDMTNTNYLNSTSSTTTQINNSNYINSITFKVEPISSAVIRFYKQDVTKDYTYPIINSKL